MAYFSINSDMKALEEVFKEYEHVEDVVNDVLHKEGAERIKRDIISILPASGRHWRGKAAAAKSTQPFEQKNGNLEVEVKSKSRYNYLYFPDDGSNTQKHFGNQQFMIKGAERSSDYIIDKILERVVRSD